MPIETTTDNSQHAKDSTPELGTKREGLPQQATEKAKITHQDIRGTVRLLLTTGEKGRTAGSQCTWEKTEKQLSNRQPLVSLSQVNSARMRVHKSEAQPELWEKVLRANQQKEKPKPREPGRELSSVQGRHCKMTPVRHSGIQDQISTYLKITLFFLLHQIVISSFLFNFFHELHSKSVVLDKFCCDYVNEKDLPHLL